MFEGMQDTDEAAIMSVANTIPLIAIQGEVDQHVVAHKVEKYLKDHFARSEFHLLRGVGHSPFLEAPEVTNKLILDFVQKHTA